MKLSPEMVGDSCIHGIIVNDVYRLELRLRPLS